jgi:hypothetical protein
VLDSNQRFSKMEGIERLALSSQVYKTRASLSMLETQNGGQRKYRAPNPKVPSVFETESMLHGFTNQNGGSPRYCPVFSRLRAKCITSYACEPMAVDGGIAPQGLLLHLFSKQGQPLDCATNQIQTIAAIL